MRSRRLRLGTWYAEGALALLAFALAIATVSRQSFWIDEVYTADVVDGDLADLVSRVRETEATPPLYYVVLHGWAALFGSEAAGLRSLSTLLMGGAVFSTAMLGRRVVSRRVGLVAALLLALNPLAWWYAQEARAYAALVFLLTLGTYFFVGASRGSRREVLLWALTMSFAVVTHYFAALIVVPQCVYLLAARSVRARDRLIGLLPIAVLVCLVPLARDQSARDFDFRELGIVERAAKLAKQLAVGYNGPAENLLAVAVLGCMTLGLVRLLVDRRQRTSRDVLIILGLALPSAVVPIAGAFLGHDYLNTRNCIGLLVPLLLAVAAGLSLFKWAALPLAAILAASLITILGVVTHVQFQRTDWRGAVERVGEARSRRALVLIGSSERPGRHYFHGSHALDAGLVKAKEIVVLGLNDEVNGGSLQPPSGFIAVDTVKRDVVRAWVIRYPVPTSFEADELRRLVRRATQSRVSLYVQPGSTGSGEG